MCLGVKNDYSQVIVTVFLLLSTLYVPKSGMLVTEQGTLGERENMLCFKLFICGGTGPQTSPDKTIKQEATATRQQGQAATGKEARLLEQG